MRWVVAALSSVVVLVGCASRQVLPAGRPGAEVPAPPTASSQQAQFARARQQVDDKQYAAAAAGFEALLPIYPQMEDYSLHYLAMSRSGRGDPAAAAGLWERLLDTHPQSVFVARARLERGRLLRAAGDPDGAEALLVAARDGGDDDVAPQASLELAEIDLARGDAPAAQADLLAARRRAPGSPPALQAKQRLVELLIRYPELAPSGDELDAEVKLLLAERDYDGARIAADSWLAVAPPARQATGLRMRADAEHGAGDVEAGLATLQVIVRQYPSSPAAPEAQFRYASLLWNRDRNEEAAQAFEELRHRYPEHTRTPEVIYALARIEQGNGQSEAAIAGYAMLADGYPTNALAREGRWRIAWIRYQDGRWFEAAAAFSAVAGGKGPGDAPDAHYWRARALERGGDRDGAELLYTAVSEEAPSSYYAFWASRRLGAERGIGAAPLPAAPAASLGAPPPGADPYHWVRARELRAIGSRAQARRELAAFERAHQDQPAVLASLPPAYQAVDGYRDAIRVTNARGGDASIAYPLAFWPQVSAQAATRNLDPLLVLALMRQESLFDPAARSPADARGLMQLLPSTAERVARQHGAPAPAGRLYDPEVNIGLGVTYLDQLMRQYGGDPLKALAAYNGGEIAVAKWEQRFGGLEPDEFVESITYRETRDYVKKVMGNYRRYQQVYGGR